MKLSKVLSIVAVTLMLVASVSNVALAINPASISGNVSGTEDVTALGSKVIGLIQTVGSVAAVLVLVILGVKYMMGSTEEKAEYKKTMMPYIIGAILVFAASNIAGFVFNWAGNI